MNGENEGLTRRGVGKIAAISITTLLSGCTEEARELLEGDEGPGISNNRDRDDTSRPQDSPTPSPTASATPTDTPTPTPTNTASPTPTQEQNEQGLAGKDNYDETRLTEDEYQTAKSDGDFFDSGEHETLDDFTESMIKDQAFQEAIDEASSVSETLQAAWSHANAQVKTENSLQIKTARHLMENLHHLDDNLEFNYSNLVVMDHTAASGGLFDAALIAYQEENGDWQIENGIPGGRTDGSDTTPVAKSVYFHGSGADRYSRLDRKAVENTAGASNWCEREAMDEEQWALLGDQISDSIRFRNEDGYNVTPDDEAGHEIMDLLLNDKENFVNFIRQANSKKNFDGKGNYMLEYSGDSNYTISPKIGEGLTPFIPRSAGDTAEFADNVEATYCTD